jgi:hypothetical protein
MLEGRNAGTVYRMDFPHLIVCEAKKASTVGKQESVAELLGQLRVLMLRQYVLPLLSLIEIVARRARPGSWRMDIIGDCSTLMLI